MTAAVQDIKAERINPEDSAYPLIDSRPVEAATNIWGNTMVAINAAGNAVPASANPALQVIGRCERQALNTVAAGSSGIAGALSVDVRPGAYWWNNSTGADLIAPANAGQLCYAADDNTVALTDGGGTRPVAGIIYNMKFDGSGKVGVLTGMGVGSLYKVNPEIPSVVSQYKARNIVTSLAAYTGSGTGTLTASANGAWPAQDGVTNAVGDVVFIPAQTTNLVGALDSGPWQIANLGGAGAKYVLQRPDWFVTGGTVVQGLDVVIGGEGTAGAGNTWRSFATPGQTIGTNDPVFYPRVQKVNSGAMVAGVMPAITSLFVRPTAEFNPLPGAPAGTQGIYRMSTATPGYPGTSSLIVTSSSGAETSTVAMQLLNF